MIMIEIRVLSGNFMRKRKSAFINMILKRGSYGTK